jgi:hypothetical protein
MTDDTLPARKEAGKAYALLVIYTPTKDQPVTSETFHFALDRKKLRQAQRREGGYLLRSNIKSDDPGYLWRLYLQLVEVEQAFKEIDAIERWAASGKISRSEAIRRLLKLGLERVPAQRRRSCLRYVALLDEQYSGAEIGYAPAQDG